MHSIDRLSPTIDSHSGLLNSRIPPGINDENVICSGQIQPKCPHLELEDKHCDLRVVAESLENTLPLFFRQCTVADLKLYLLNPKMKF